MKDYQMSESGMCKLTELAGSRRADDKLRVIESAIDRMYQQTSTFEMLRALQERLPSDSAASWILVWDRRPQYKYWVCSLCDHDHYPPSDTRHGSPIKVFVADDAEECIREAWESEKEGREMSDG